MQRLTCLLLGIFLFVGCGGSDRPEVVPVSGVITYKGKPVKSAEVTFHPVSDAIPRKAIGKTNDSGEFDLTTYDTGDGAIPGECIVTVIKLESSTTTVSDDSDPMDESGAEYDRMMNLAANTKTQFIGKLQLPQKYASVDTSPEKRTIVSGDTNVFNIELTD